jgi:CheY-like chemotaxis protein
MYAGPDQGDPEVMDMRCFIVDDNLCFLRAIRHMLERDGATVVGTATSGNEAVERALACRPDVVLVDVRLGYESGFDVARRIEELSTVGSRRPAIILVSTHRADELAERIAANPSFGFLDKTRVSGAKVRALLCTRAASGTSLR